MMRTWMLLGFLVSAQLAATGQDVPSPGSESFPEQLAMLRTGTWSEERVGGVVGTLLDRDRILAAGWWIAEAEEALVAKNLPGSARSLLLDLKRRFRARAGTLDPEAYRLSEGLARHAEEVVREKNYALADQALALAERHLMLFPSSQAETKLERARRKLPPEGERFDRGPRALAKQRARTEELSAAHRRALEERWERFVRDYCDHGNFGSYARVRNLVLTACPMEQRARVLTALRNATLAFHDGQKLEIWVIGSEPLTLVMNDEEKGRQPGMWPYPDVDSVPDWKSFTLSVLPGDMIEFRFRSRHGEMAPDFVMIHARVAGRAVPRSAFRSVDPERPTTLGPARFGEIGESGAHLREVSPDAPKRGVGFAGGESERSSARIEERCFMPVKDCVFDWFRKHDLDVICVAGYRERKSPVLVVPDPGN